MAEGIYLPPDFWYATVAKVTFQESKSDRVLINDGIVMSGRFIVHAPTTKDEFQTTFNDTLILCDGDMQG